MQNYQLDIDLTVFGEFTICMKGNSVLRWKEQVHVSQQPNIMSQATNISILNCNNKGVYRRKQF